MQACKHAKQLETPERDPGQMIANIRNLIYLTKETDAFKHETPNPTKSEQTNNEQTHKAIGKLERFSDDEANVETMSNKGTVSRRC